jgi:uncharacterized protein YsxB (DUF464 family)
MTEQAAMGFVAELEKLCEQYHAYCKLELTKKPKLELVCATVSLKVDGADNS